MASPIRETIEDDVKALIYEERIQGAEIGVERVSLLHHLYESITQLTTRNVKRNNVGPIQIAVRLSVEPSFSLQAIVKRRRGNRMQLPNQRPFLHRGERAAHDSHHAARFDFSQDLAHTPALDAHASQTD